MITGRLGLGEQRDRLADPLGVGRPALDSPASLAEEVGGIIVRMGLDVLRQRDRDGPRLGRVGQHAHRLGQGGQDLLGPRDPVEEPAHRPEAVVDAHVGRDRVLELLQHGPLVPGRVVVGGEQQHRQAVDRGRGRARDHVGRARPDRRRAGQRGQPPVGLGEADRRVDHRLLVAWLVVGQVPAAFLQRLAHAADVAVAEDAEHRGDQAARSARRARCTAPGDTSPPPGPWSGGWSRGRERRS